MSAPVRLAAFAAGLALLFGGGVLAGDLLGPAPDAGASAVDAHGGRAADSHAGRSAAPHAGRAAAPHAGEAPGGHGAGATPPPVRGLAVAADGLRLVVPDAELRRGRAERLVFRIVDARGRTVRAFDVAHARWMHLILARRDSRGFQHLHPEQRADGAWVASVRIDRAGSYRLFADFSRSGRAHTLAADLHVDGPADLRPWPAPGRTSVTDRGYDVALETERVRPGEAARLRFTVTRDGAPVRTDPYLGAGGHLVALREGDLAFLHVHPTGRGTRDAGSVGFAATFPTEGRYRLFLQFAHAGRVQTAAFTQAVTRR